MIRFVLPAVISTVSLAAMLCPARAGAADLVVLIKQKNLQGRQEPMAGKEFQKGLGELLAEQLKRKPVFRYLPRKRLAMALAAGEADILCGYTSEWLQGDFVWSKPFIPVADIVITNSSVSRPLTVADLSGQKIGTILGYGYPELEQALGERFVREDSLTGQQALRKLILHRFEHVVLSRSSLDYFLRHEGPGAAALSIHPPLVVRDAATQCALSPRSQVSLDELNAVIAHIVKQGMLSRLIEQSTSD